VAKRRASVAQTRDFSTQNAGLLLHGIITSSTNLSHLKFFALRNLQRGTLLVDALQCVSEQLAVTKYLD